MYAIHQSQALVLDTLDTGEKNRFFWLFTREFGLINATAMSVRSNTSKLGPHLQSYNILTVEFVQGKDIFRLTNVLPLDSEYHFLTATKKTQYLVAEITLLLKRLFVGQEAHPELFDEVVQGFEKATRIFDEQTLDALQTLLTIKVLHHLGYWQETDELYSLATSSFSSEIFDKILKKKKELRDRIEQSLRESHL